MIIVIILVLWLAPPHVLYLYVKAMYQPTKLSELFAYWWRQLISLSYKRTLNTLSGGWMSRGMKYEMNLKKTFHHTVRCTHVIWSFICFNTLNRLSTFLRAKKPQLWHEESLRFNTWRTLVFHPISTSWSCLMWSTVISNNTWRQNITGVGAFFCIFQAPYCSFFKKCKGRFWGFPRYTALAPKPIETIVANIETLSNVDL